MNLEQELQKYIDNFRFFIVDENNVQRSSTWTIRQNNSEDSVFVYTKSHGQKMTLSLHPRNTSHDGNDSQWGIKKKHREELEEQGFTVPRPLRWKRPYDNEKVKRVASILFPTDYMTGEVYQYVQEKERKVAIPMAKAGHAVEVSLFYHYANQSPDEVADQLLKRFSYTPVFYMTVSTGEIVNIAFRQIPFDRSSLPKAGTYGGHKLTNQKIESTKFMHAICHNSPNDGEAICLIETNGFKFNN